ncbi:MAG: 2-dehydro-3-deoxygalactonokinase [Gammaproteobacteria bacterium]|nr:2-dehydro-3-deoxygalactonokinase [Gammaproteobacteria bacterium]
MSGSASMVAVDWGSSRFRAYLLAADGTALAQTDNDYGIFKVKQGGFAGVLYEACGSWLERAPELPVFMFGMVGSREGWVETDYLKCPATVDDLGKHLVRVPDLQDHPAFIVPGLSCDGPAFTDVMRGEETQVLGTEAAAGGDLVCLPGTHSKWVRYDGAAIRYFATFLTGELFASIRHAASVRAIIRHEDFAADAFEEGLRVSKKPGGLTHHVFSIRSRLLTQESLCGAHASYLSGLLIGAEIGAGLALCPVKRGVRLVGSRSLLRQYEQAFALFDIPTWCVTSEQASIQGLWKLAVSSGQCIPTGTKKNVR